MLTASLAAGRLSDARECCRAAVDFLATALCHVPEHPLLALQVRHPLDDHSMAPECPLDGLWMTPCCSLYDASMVP